MILKIIADSSAIISLISQTDSNHKIASAMVKKEIIQKSGIILPAEIFTETINLLGKKFGHSIAYAAAKSLTSYSFMRIESSMESIRTEALEKFKKLSPSTSYTDCLVMAFADHFETKYIFGFDECFAKNGYLSPA